MSKYDFNAERCKKAIEGLSKIVYETGYAAIPTREQVRLGCILDDLIIDIEDLHRRAQERDDVLEAMIDAIWFDDDRYMDIAEARELRKIYHRYTDEDGNLNRTEALSL
jgi:hypothetical protein